MAESMPLSDVLVIGSNDHGYQFAVGRMETRWIGFAIGDLEDGTRMLFIFPEVSQGVLLGLANKVQAIRLTAAVACDPEQGYGGIKRWRIPPRLRGTPEEFRCERCHALNCDGFCGDELEIDLPVDVDRRVCRVCGCTDDAACEGGCYWVEADLCSQCAARKTMRVRR